MVTPRQAPVPVPAPSSRPRRAQRVPERDRLSSASSRFSSTDALISDASDSRFPSEAACAGLDPDDFYPEGKTEEIAPIVERAKAVCAECTVRWPCLAVALLNGEGNGIWGGLTERERRRLRRELAARDVLLRFADF